jgi:ABC-type Fe3+ transport system permease subunit
VATGGNGLAWGSFVAGLASVATLPLAIYLTRYGDRYELIHAAFAIPLAGALAFLAISLARRARRLSVIRLGRGGGRPGLVRAGRLLGIAGLCLALAAVVALGVYGLLEYVSSRE